MPYILYTKTMNVMPWGGPTMRAATVLNADPTEIWHSLIPIQISMIVITFVMAFIFSLREKKRLKAISGTVSSDTNAANAEPEFNHETHGPKWKRYFNYVLTIALIAVLVSGKISSTVAFMIALCLGLIVNVPDLKEQSAKLKEYGTAAMSMVVTLFAAGVFTGVLSQTGMLEAMASAVVTIIPAGLGRYTHIIVACFAVPLIMCLGTDSFYFGLLPIVVGIAGNFGVEPIAVARVLIVAENIGVLISPLSPAEYLGLGMLDLDVGDHIRFSFPWVWGISIFSVFLCILYGIVPV